MTTYLIILYETLIHHRFPSVLELQRLMRGVGFTVGPALSHNSENYYKPQMLYDKEGPFRQEWRSRDGYVVFTLQ